MRESSGENNGQGGPAEMTTDQTSADRPDDLIPDASFDGGDLDCGNGLLLLIRRHIDPLPAGGLLEIRSRERSVQEDLPAWCRMTHNELVQVQPSAAETRFLVCKGPLSGRRPPAAGPLAVVSAPGSWRPADAQRTGQRAVGMEPSRAATSLGLGFPPGLDSGPTIPDLPVMGIGSWPRPPWLRQALSASVQGQMSAADFQATADDAVRLVIDNQHRAGVQVITDGEQRRDSYASFVGGILDNCQLIPLTDLLPYVDDPTQFAAELRALDVPAAEVRHPAVFGPLGRSRPLAVGEYAFARQQTALPIKIALPGPYLLTRTMWMECLSDRAYESRLTLADDIVRVLREELVELLQAGVAMVQFDEPVLTEVALGQPSAQRSFMCGALSERLPPAEELQLALELFTRLTDGLPLERVALHICRGNWTPDESKALTGSYESLLDFLCRVPVGNYFLEACTPRAGEWSVLADLPADRRVGLGMVNQKHAEIESADDVCRRAEAALRWFGPERLMLTPDCGFATFAENPISSAAIATEKLAVLARARARLLGSPTTG
jgi:5-methyltetrahydropteroyltriglutamate--homocysteine methyltransferase